MNAKKLLLLFVILLGLTVLTMFLLYPVIHVPARDLPEIMKDKTLNVVMESGSDDSIAGFQYELCKYIGKRSDLTVQIIPENNFNLCIQGLKNNTYDVIARNISITNENKQYLAFTVPITISNQVLVQRQSDETDSTQIFICNQIDLADKTVYVIKNSAATLRLKNLSEEIAESIHIREISDNSSENLIYMVCNKEIDYAVVDKTLARKIASQLPEIDYSMDIGFNQLQAWAVRPSSPILLDSLNVWITDFVNAR
ncbi:MAG: transporter substrate-binding domain-containing protein [Dysgonamonadaceae bacterium]|jgi:ABC-type amino acid transport substrate-binding protein|nr:transporter substrate-binding domain-containing protein [Dysgonamonadaceae bacterium]